MSAISFAWDIDLQPKQKLAMLYMADAHWIAAELDKGKLARFVGIAVWEVDTLVQELFNLGYLNRPARDTYEIRYR